jgi:AraC-like DNA-binding protein
VTPQNTRCCSLPIREAPHEFGDVVRAAVVPANTLLQQDQAARARLAELAERLLTAPLEVRAKAAGADPERLSARLALAHALLQGSGVLAYEATYLLGFESLNAFERAFFERFQLLPSQVRSPT